MSEVIRIHTFAPPANARGEDQGDFVGNLRKGELRGIIKINEANCVGCDTCRKVCPVSAISGGLGVVHSIREDACVACGQCLIACPFNAIEQMSFVDEVLAKLDDPSVTVLAHPSPAVRVSVGEEFGAKTGELITEQFVNALEAAGIVCYDVNQSADQTIIEEGMEFVKKIQYWVLGHRGPEVEKVAHHPFPHFTSCCPAWVKNAETYHAGILPHLSTAKSPIQIGGPVAKVWASEHVLGVDPRKIYMVATTPCTAKIFEASRPEMCDAWKYLVANGKIPADTPKFPDIDAVLTARDIAEIFRRKGIDPMKMPKTRNRDEHPLEIYTGAGTIFGVSGGVMEAALRTAYFALSGEELKDPDIKVVRGYDDAIVEATIPVPIKELGGKIFEVRVCVVNGALQGLETVLRRIEEDKNRYHFIEVMNCPGGCVNGGGQPVRTNGATWLKPTLPIPVQI